MIEKKTLRLNNGTLMDYSMLLILNKTYDKFTQKEREGRVLRVKESLENFGLYLAEPLWSILNSLKAEGNLTLIDLLEQNDSAHDVEHSLFVYENLHKCFCTYGFKFEWLNKIDNSNGLIDLNLFFILFALIHDAWSKVDRENHNIKAGDYVWKLATHLQKLGMVKDQDLEALEILTLACRICRSKVDSNLTSDKETEVYSFFKAADLGPLDLLPMLKRMFSYRLTQDETSAKSFDNVLKSSMEHLNSKYSRNGYVKLTRVWNAVYNSHGELEDFYNEVDEFSKLLGLESSIGESVCLKE